MKKDKTNQESPEAVNSALNTLLACPFCGGKAELQINLRNNRVRCTDCGYSGGHAFYSEKNAIEQWNIRKS